MSLKFAGLSVYVSQNDRFTYVLDLRKTYKNEV